MSRASARRSVAEPHRSNTPSTLFEPQRTNTPSTLFEPQAMSGASAGRRLCSHLPRAPPVSEPSFPGRYVRRDANLTSCPSAKSFLKPVKHKVDLRESRL